MNVQHDFMTATELEMAQKVDKDKLRYILTYKLLSRIITVGLTILGGLLGLGQFTA